MQSLIVCDLYYEQLAQLVSSNHYSAYAININKKVNTITTLTFNIPYNSPHVEYLIAGNLILFEDEYYFIRKPNVNRDDNTVMDVECEHMSSSLASIICGEYEFQAETVKTLVNEVLKNTNWTFGETDIADSNLKHLVSTNETALSNLMNIAEVFNSVVVFTTKDKVNKVNIYHNKIERGTFFTNTKNVKSIGLSYDSNDMITRVHAFGGVDKTTGIETSIIGITNGKTYVEDYSFYINQGYKLDYILSHPELFLREAEIRLTEIFDEQKLYDMAVDELNRRKVPKLNCTISALDLSGIPKYFIERPEINENIIVRDEELDLEFEATVVGFSKNYDDDLDMTIDISSVIEYGSFMKDIIDKVDKSDIAITNINKSWGEVIEEARNEATDVINGGLKNSNVILRKDELLIMNTTDPATATEIWRWNLGGLAYGNSYNGQFKTALTKDGKFVIDEITCSGFTAKLIKTGLLSDLTGKTWINMDNGTFNFANRISFDGNEFKIVLSNGKDVESTIYDQNQILKNELTGKIDDVDKRIDNILDDVDGALADGVIDEAESNMIANKLLDFEREFISIGNEYDKIYTNVDLKGTAKTNLYNAKQDYNSKYVLLTDSIKNIISDGKATESEKLTYKTNVGNYNASYGTLSVRLVEALDSIALNRGAEYQKQLQDMKVEINTEISDVSGALNDLENTMNGVFKDGIIDEIELKTIEERLVALDKEKSDLDSQYNTVYGNTSLIGTAKSELKAAKDNFNTAHTNLKNAINNTVSDGLATDTEIADIKNKTTVYNNNLAVLVEKINKAIDSIASQKATDSLNSAIAYADGQFNDVNNVIGDLNNTINTTFKDGIISEAEVIAIKRDIDRLQVEKTDIDKIYTSTYSNADLIGTAKTNLLNAKNDYNSKHTALMNAINNAIADKKITADESAAVATAFTNYGNSLGTFNQRISEAINAIAEVKKTGAITTATTEVYDNVYKKTETYTKSQTDTQINASKESIELSVSNTYETKTNVTTKINNAIGGLEIGGTNMVLNSAPHKTGWSWAGTSGTMALVDETTALKGKAMAGTVSVSGTSAGMHNSPKTRLTVGKEYSWSVWLKANKTLTVKVGCEQNGTKNCTVTTTWQKFSHTFTANDYQYQSFVIYIQNAVANDVIYAHSIKVEEGNKPTAYTQAPEDVAEEITDVKNTATTVAGKITDMESDGKLTPLEKQALKKDWDVIVKEKPSIEAQATKYELTTEKTNYINAYNTLNSYITPILSSLTTTSNVTGDTTRTNFSTYYQRKEELLQKISDLNKTNTDTLTSSLSQTNTKLSEITIDLEGITSRVESTEDVVYKGSGNLLANSNWIKGNQGWRLSTAATNFTVDTTNDANAKEDKRSIRLGSTTDTTVNPIYADSPKFCVSEGEKITYSAYISAYSNATVQLFLLFTDNIQDITDNNSYFTGYTGITSTTTAYSKHSKTVTVPTGATRAFVRMRIDKKDTAVNTNSYGIFNSIMVNRGEKSLPWVPNQEDSFGYSNEKFAEIKVTTDSINQKVSKVETKSSQVQLGIRCHDLGFQMNRSALNGATANGYLFMHGYKTSNNVETESATTGYIYFNNKTISAVSAALNIGSLYSVFGTKDVYLCCHSTTAGVYYGVYFDDTQNKWWYRQIYGGTTSSEYFLSNSTYICIGKFKLSSATAFTYANLLVAPNLVRDVVDLQAYEKRMYDAEQQIKPDSIVSTVRSSTEYKNDLGSKATVEDVSSLTQTVNGFKFEVSKGGGQNLIRNSVARNGAEFWVAGRHSGSGSVTISTTSKKFDRDTLEFTITTLETIGGIMTHAIPVRANNEYTLTCYHPYTHRGDDVTVEVMCWSSENNSYNTNPNVAKLYPGRLQRDQDNKITFTVPTNTTHIQLYFYSRYTSYNSTYNYAHVFLRNLTLTKGSVGSGWQPHSSEIYSGITVIDGDGVTVTHSQSSTYTNLNSEGLSIYSTSGKQIANFGSNNSAVIGTLDADTIVSNNVIPQLRDKGQIQCYVAVNATGDGTGRDTSNRANSVSTAIMNIFKRYGQIWTPTSGAILSSTAIQVNIWYGGTFTENVELKDFIGEGEVKFDVGYDMTVTGKWEFRNCKNINISGGRTNHDTNNGAIFKRNGGYDSLAFFGCLHAYVEKCRFNNTVKNNSAISGRWGSSVHISLCDFYQGGWALWLDYNCKGASYLCRGHNFGSGAFRAANGSIIIWEKARPSGNVVSAIAGWGTKTTGEGQEPWEVNSCQVAPPASTWGWVEQTFSLTNLRTAPEGSGSATSSRSGQWGQGAWSPYKAHRGYADLGGSPSSWCSGGRNFTVTLTMNRINTSHGNASNSPQPKIKQTDGTFWNSGVGFNRGETKTITLSSNIANGIASGSIKTLEMWAGTDSSQYSFYENATIKITCEKQV